MQRRRRARDSRAAKNECYRQARSSDDADVPVEHDGGFANRIHFGMRPSICRLMNRRFDEPACRWRDIGRQHIL
jgi:hypothetical protein